MITAVNDLKNYKKETNHFLVPVQAKKHSAPRYNLIVRNPKDLGTISKQLNSLTNGYKHLLSVDDDIVKVRF